jgi:AcrR family transcriptional regulator
MFGDLTVDAVSMRAVARGVAPRAVTYHFPTKRDLVAAVLDRRSGLVGDAISHRLNHLAKEVADVHIEDVVEAVVIPFADMLNVDPQGGLRWMKIFATLALSEDEIWAGRLGDMVEAYLAAAGRALPDVASEQAHTRVRSQCSASSTHWHARIALHTAVPFRPTASTVVGSPSSWRIRARG